MFKKCVEAIFKEADGREFRFMDFCGGHTYALAKNGINSILPTNVHMIHGPGCPVCVLPVARVAMGMEIAKRKDVILCTYGDVLKVPDNKGFSLFKMKAEGADIRAVYSVLDAVKTAMENPDKKVVFFAVGFETTAPLTAAAIVFAKKKNVRNFFVLANHLLTEKAMGAVLNYAHLDGVVAPGHVAAITGFDIFQMLAGKFKVPMVVTGFEAMDLITAILMLIRQVRRSSFNVENEYRRALIPEGNAVALDMLDKVFAKRKDFIWRGLGKIADSAFDFADEFAEFDVEKVFALTEQESAEPKGCICPLVIRGEKDPLQCPLFGKVCVPENPVGACMVSSEGTCGACFKYKVRDKK